METQLPQPEIRALDLWQHQVAAYHFARERQAAMLALRMGEGKSLVALTAIAGEGHKRVLILCPASVRGVWRREIHKHYPLPHNAMILDGGTSAAKAKIVASARQLADPNETTFVAVNYESAWRKPLSEVLLAFGFTAAVLDESHRIKSPGGKASKWAQRLGRVVKRRLALTGTPMPHSPLDLYAQFRFLEPTIFGTSFVAFRSRYAETHPEFPSKVLKWTNQDDLQEKFASIAFRCDEDVLDLPPATHDVVQVNLGGTARRAYDLLEAELVCHLGDGTITTNNALTHLLRLQQLTSGVAKLDDATEPTIMDTAKRDALIDLLIDLPTNEPVVCFGRFRADLAAMRTVAESLGRNYGEVSSQRKDLTPHGEYPPGIDFLGVQIQSGGVGIDLTRAAYAVYYSLGFSLGDYDQSLARLHRPGQTRCVHYYHLVATKSVDEIVYRTLKSRRNVVDGVLSIFAQQKQRELSHVG